MSQFIYLLNAFEGASQDDAPADVGYAEKRKAVLDYVAKLEADAQRYVNRESVIEECAKAAESVCGSPWHAGSAREAAQRIRTLALRECESEQSK
jgi:hypothetical protein